VWRWGAGHNRWLETMRLPFPFFFPDHFFSSSKLVATKFAQIQTNTPFIPNLYDELSRRFSKTINSFA
jgi:hypothetical protein